ncbi:MAG: phenylalanine--tRNA ligase subunit alpha, partial [Gammaproteobacteria bacterium]|nr:phenylalanine--tRNA ligase subunit alpha [Gammaproteobacteria bacterium]
MQTLDEILKNAEREIQSASDLKLLDNYRIQYLGKKGQLTEFLKSLGQLPPADRPAAGQKINLIKEKIQTLINEQDKILKASLIEEKLLSESIDITLSGRSQTVGSIHPIIKTFQDLRRIFSQMGFSFMDGPEIEDDYHNFQ